MLSETRRYQLVFFGFYASMNGFVVFRNVYFEELGLSGGQMGLIGGVLVVTAMLAVQLLLGVGLALYVLGVVTLPYEFAPTELSATVQALLFSIGLGTGRALGETAAVVVAFVRARLRINDGARSSRGGVKSHLPFGNY